MTRVLVAYASKHGSTAEIAQAISEELTRQGLEVDCRRADEVKHLDGYDAVVLGSAVYMKRWQADARKLLRRHADELAKRPFWIFSSGPFGKEPDLSWSEPPRVVEKAQQLGVRDHVIFGGRLPVEPSGFMERALVRDTPPEYADLRHWSEIRAWASRIAASLRETPSAAGIAT
ncbi:MAG TPA: flavodoxin domain-containing protein [Solirubrobacteraceae bacterium]|nr:flavodoxin domain-containing protein [Solirubrobacteraceae bacterium]